MEHDIFCNCDNCCIIRGGEICPTCGCLVEPKPEGNGCGCVNGSSSWFNREEKESMIAG